MEKALQCSFKRYEMKYLLSPEQYAALLNGMQDRMEPDIYGETTNCNIYYDTDNWELIRKSIEKPVYKEKLRVRSYGVPGSSDPVFIEIKKKYEGVVYKRRLTMPAANAEPYLSGDMTFSPGTQIAGEIEWFQKRYQAKPRVYIAYDRTSYAGRENRELRITFDRNIRFRECDLDLQKGDYGLPLLTDDSILMEIKIPGTAPLWLAGLLSECSIRPASFSKYGYYYKNCVLNQSKKELINYVRFHHPALADDGVLPDVHSRLPRARTA